MNGTQSSMEKLVGQACGGSGVNERIKELLKQSAIEKFAELVAAAEREACAKASLKHSHRDDDMGAIIAAAIRARGGE